MFSDPGPLLDECYEQRGWDKQNGALTAETILALGLKEYARQMSGLETG